MARSTWQTSTAALPETSSPAKIAPPSNQTPAEASAKFTAGGAASAND